MSLLGSRLVIGLRLRPALEEAEIDVPQPQPGRQNPAQHSRNDDLNREAPHSPGQCTGDRPVGRWSAARHRGRGQGRLGCRSGSAAPAPESTGRLKRAEAASPPAECLPSAYCTLRQLAVHTRASTRCIAPVPVCRSTHPAVRGLDTRTQGVRRRLSHARLWHTRNGVRPNAGGGLTCPDWMAHHRHEPAHNRSDLMPVRLAARA